MNGHISEESAPTPCSSAVMPVRVRGSFSLWAALPPPRPQMSCPGSDRSPPLSYRCCRLCESRISAPALTADILLPKEYANE